MNPDRKPLRAPELLQPRVEVLKAGLKRLEEEEVALLVLGATAFFEKPVDPTAIAAAASSGLQREAKRKLGRSYLGRPSMTQSTRPTRSWRKAWKLGGILS